ncbi:hypothetical protein K1720_01630 [Thermococcus argininiproducens]|uniref:Uncharacterized protein n=1 Tax=Thermococcus argininiproducens TaxID=2866384 RepID=A0A9E7SCM9_9EURY|nr:hypothetical protein [Thermococcus argininiproducens]USH00204.1 hypothetical protein K1720_01630 [Thermococcus argininiproducens]
MRRKLIVLIVLLLITSMVSSQTLLFSTLEEKIVVISGDYKEGTLTLINNADKDFQIVTFRRYYVLDSKNNEISGITLEIYKPDGEPLSTGVLYTYWKSGEERTLRYKIYVNESVKPGTYTLFMVLWGFLSSGDLRVIQIPVTLEITDVPLMFKEAFVEVKERSVKTNRILTGETIVIYSTVHNLKNSPVSINGTAYLEKNGKRYLKTDIAMNLTPGDNSLQVEIPIPYDLQAGEYRLIYKLEYSKGTYLFSKVFYITFGVDLTAISLEKTEVMEDEKNTLYLTLFSERDIVVNYTIEVYGVNNELLHNSTKAIKIEKGSTIIQDEIPSLSPGSKKIMSKISFGKITLDQGSISYNVLAYPQIENILYKEISLNENKATVQFSITLSNANSKEVVTKLSYRFFRPNETIHKGSRDLSLSPGENYVNITLELPIGEKIYYEFSLIQNNKEQKISGDLEIKPPAPPTSTFSQSSTPLTSTTNTTIPTPAPQQRNILTYIAILLIIIFLVLLILYLKPAPSKKRRERPKPKRRSPIGKFKRPKEPEIKEYRELPKK